MEIFKMLTSFDFIIFLNFGTIISNFKFIPYFDILQAFVKKKLLSWAGTINRD